MKHAAILALLGLSLGAGAFAQEDEQKNLFSWRGPFQSQLSVEKYESWAPPGEKELAWSHSVRSRGCPIIVDNKVYAFGYSGSGAELQIHLTCLDADSGKVYFDHKANDFLSDLAYDRYAIGSPTVDPETRNVYLLTSANLLTCWDKEGKQVWEHSLTESFGFLTFPNGRSGAPLIEGDLVIVHGINSFWGAQGPGRDRFYAFDKRTGTPIWGSEPGLQPRDSSHSTPFVETRDGRRVMYAGLGCGNIVAMNALTGQPLWRFQFSKAGVSSSMVVYGDQLICVHGQENLDSTEEGRMIALKLPDKLVGPNEPPVELPPSAELWRQPVSAFTSSPCVANDRVYCMNKSGNLSCIDLKTGKKLWDKKLDVGNTHGSPIIADGIIYMAIESGMLKVIKPSDSDAEILAEIPLEGNCYGAPAINQGRLYVHTSEKLYCWKMKTGKISYLPLPEKKPLSMGQPVALTVVPNEVLLKAGEKQDFKTYEMDAVGLRGKQVSGATWEKFIPPTAKVKATLDATMEGNELVTTKASKQTAGLFKATLAGKSGTFRGRILANPPYEEDFEKFEINVPHETEPGVKLAYPPLPWIGGRLKWEVREQAGSKVLAKTLDNIFFQRAFTFIGHPDMKNYTLQADVMTDGTRRVKSEVGLINQRYLFDLKGNGNLLEISSNQERIKVDTPFPVKANVWYTMKTRVDMAADGSAVIRGKVWEKTTAEPDKWTLEVPHKKGHTKGAPGVFGFSPQAQKRVFIDNIKLTPNN